MIVTTAAWRHVRLFAVAAVCAVVFVVAFARSEPAGSILLKPAADLRSAPAQAEWKTVEHRGVQIDIPSTWVQVDMSHCELRYERWAAPGTPACEYEEGAAFYVSATFDPAHGPGIRRAGPAGWAGYVYAGDYAVYVYENDHDLVRRVLDSVR